MGRRSQHERIEYYPSPSADPTERKRYFRWAEGGGHWWIIWFIVILLFAPLLVIIFQ